MVCPVIDVIDDDTLQYHYRDSSGVNVGGFDWNLQVCYTYWVFESFEGKQCGPRVASGPCLPNGPITQPSP